MDQPISWVVRYVTDIVQELKMWTYMMGADD
jgi:hypothetical protein